MDLNELMTSSYNIEEDKIVNAKKGSLIWYHESGHRFLCKKNKTFMTIRTTFVNLMVIAFAFLCLNSSNPSLAIYGSCILGLILFEEIFAWLYAFNKKGVSHRR